MWTPASTESFEQLRCAITTTLVLAMSKVFVVECDASRSNIAAVLMQELNHIAFISETFFDKNLGLSNYEMELLEVVFAITKWRPYLVGQHFKVKSDYFSSKYLLEQRITTPLQQKCVTKLLEYILRLFIEVAKKIKWQMIYLKNLNIKFWH